MTRQEFLHELENLLAQIPRHALALRLCPPVSQGIIHLHSIFFR